MLIRLTLAAPQPSTRELFTTLLSSALTLAPLNVVSSQVESEDELLVRIAQQQDDVVVLDWMLAREETPHLVQRILQLAPGLRVIALLPLAYRQYGREVWSAGACTSIAKEHMEQEWLSSVLCVMHRAMEREARLRAEYGLEPATIVMPSSCCSAE